LSTNIFLRLQPALINKSICKSKFR
jgi:hypothetical protein